MHKGFKIDIRWSGGWLTPEGTYLQVDYANGITHETIADEYGSKMVGSGRLMTQPPVIRVFDILKWMRITYLENSSFCVEVKGSFVETFSGSSFTGKGNLTEEELYLYNRKRQSVLLRFSKDFKGFDEYFINESKYSSHREFLTAIRNNEVVPRGTNLGFFAKMRAYQTMFIPLTVNLKSGKTTPDQNGSSQITQHTDIHKL